MISVLHRGQTYWISLDEGENDLVNLQKQLESVTKVSVSDQKLLWKGKRLKQLNPAVFEAKKPVLLFGTPNNELNAFHQEEERLHKERSIRQNRSIVDVSKRNNKLRELPEYRFYDIKALPSFPDHEKARELLEMLAADVGVLAVMKKHQWKVGSLEEMYPDGKVGVDPVCVLGLNTNRGQRIQLRLRTDDLQGFRKLLTIKKTLYHELAHNVHGDHDEKFYQLLRQIEREVVELDWTKSSSQRRLGGGSINDGTLSAGELAAQAAERREKVKKLTAMGFPQDKAISALEINDYDCDQALRHLGN